MLNDPVIQQLVVTPVIIEQPQNIPLLIRYGQPDLATMLYDWMNPGGPGNDYDFLLNFAVPNIVAYSAYVNTLQEPTRTTLLNAFNPLPVGVTWPFTADQFRRDRLIPAKAEWLKSRPYRILHMHTTKDAAGDYDCTYMSVPPIEFLAGMVYCEILPTGFITGIPQYILSAMVESTLRTETFLPQAPKIVIMDLYLFRPRPDAGPGAPIHGFHCDSNTAFGDYDRTGGRPNGSENVEYLSLLMLMEPGVITKSTSVIVHQTSAADTGGLVVDATGNSYKTMLTLLAMNGTLFLIDDKAWFHSTPCREVVLADRDATSGLVDPHGTHERVLQRPTALARKLNPAAKDELERNTPRSFLRAHFCGTLNLVHNYTAVGAPVHFALAILAVPNIRIGAAVAEVALPDELNALLPKINEQTDFGIGGTKKIRKTKNKTKNKKGGGKDQSFMISCNVKDYYYFGKNKTGYTILIK